MSPISEAQKRATAKYEAKKYDKPVIRMEKGKKNIVSTHAQEYGESFNGFVNRAINETMNRDKKESIRIQSRERREKLKTMQILCDIPEDYDGPAIYALIDDEGKKYICSTMHLRQRLLSHKTHMKIALVDGINGFINQKLVDAVLSGRKFHAVILEQFPANIGPERLMEREGFHLESCGGIDNTYNLVPIKQSNCQPGDIMEYVKDENNV